MSKEYRRRAHHAGSWYEDDSQDLSETLDAFLSETETPSTEGAAGLPRGIIAPHAGYSYSGPTAAHAYMHLKEALMRGWNGTVVVLHPSHHAYLDGCAVSGAHVIETPICDIPVDSALRLELLQTGEFTTMNRKTDEQEHSGEMQYPYIAKIYTEVKSIHKDIRPLRILPIMVGATSHARHFGHLLAPVLSRPNIFTVISTDFCHWGSRFGYSPTNSTDEAQSFSEIHEYIEWLDRQGMDKISLQEPGAFATYMKRYKNTICGRYPISVYLYALKKGKESDFENLDLRFVKYAQSSRVKTLNESSVSYASAVARKIS